jgi:hypothetical protein
LALRNARDPTQIIANRNNAQTIGHVIDDIHMDLCRPQPSKGKIFGMHLLNPGLDQQL